MFHLFHLIGHNKQLGQENVAQENTNLLSDLEEELLNRLKEAN